MKVRKLLLTGVALLVFNAAAEVITVPVIDATPLEIEPQAPSLQPFSTHYKASYKFSFFSIDIKAIKTLTPLADGRWQLSFDAKTTGASLNELSVFKLDNAQIIPQEYFYKTGGLLQQDPQHQRFDAEKKEIHDLELKKIYADIWQENLQDNLTYIQQASLDVAAGKTDLNYYFYNGKSVRNYHFKVVEEGTLDTNVGLLNTIKVQRINDKKDRTTYVWLAKDHEYQLVRLAIYTKNKITYQIDLDHF